MEKKIKVMRRKSNFFISQKLINFNDTDTLILIQPSSEANISLNFFIFNHIFKTS